MYRDSCDAFYVKLRGDGTNCHMVEESDTKRTIGYGQDRLDVYYVKQVCKVRSRPISLDIFVFSYIHSLSMAGSPCFHSWPQEALRSQISSSPGSEPTVNKSGCRTIQM